MSVPFLLVVAVGLWLKVRAEVCVLEPMVTMWHPNCTPPTNCTGNHWYNYDVYEQRPTILTVYEPLPPLQPGSPAFGHFQSVKSGDTLSPNEYVIGSRVHPLTRFHIPGGVRAVFRCDDVTCESDCMYRSYDGTYNNLNHTDWGKSNTAFLRLLVPRYNGPGGQVATSVDDDSELPNARWLSTQIFPDMDRPSPNFTLAAMQWGQLLAHDIGLSPNSAENCCVNASMFAGQCMSIKIPADDPFYSKYNQTCMNMMRTDSESVTYGCLNYPNQICSVTHYIDLSLVYGSNRTTALSLRQCRGGLLQVKNFGSRVFLPLSPDPSFDCNVPSNNETCFRAGDTRVNQNTQLTCLQTVLLREHNRIATELATINPDWDDETLYQETRAILIAVFQHISYNEWLPIILGDRYMKQHSLYPLKSGYTCDYRADVNPSTLNSFMTGAYRVFHSGIQGQLQMINTTTRCPFATLNISDWMLKPGIITNNSNLDELLLGLTVEPVQEIDRFFTTQMTEMMFHDSFPYGEDLESFDIQRGRDHGIPPYNIMRELCHLPKAKNFSDLIPDMGKQHVQLLVKTYKNVDDIDYFVGGTLERPIPGTPLGPSFLCLVGEQFVRKKIGDRFWYENGDQKHSFTKEQLQEIRKSSLSRLLCDNGDNITHMQPNGFVYSTIKGNAVVPCSKIPALNLSAWADN